MMESQRSFLASPYCIKKTVPLPSSLHTVNSQFALPFQCPSARAKGNTVSHVGSDLRTPVLMYSRLYVALSMVTETIRSMFHFRKGN